MATADQKRIGRDRHTGLLHDLELAVTVDASDAGPEIGVTGGGTDRDAALWRIIVRTEHARLDQIGLYRVRLGERVGEEMNLKICGFRTHVGRLIIAVTRLVAPDEIFITPAAHRLKIRCGRDVAASNIEAHRARL